MSPSIPAPPRPRVLSLLAASLLAAAGLHGQSVPDGQAIAAATTTIIANTTSIPLPGSGISGSLITVPPGLGSLEKLTITLHGMTEPIPSYINSLLVTGPRGQQVYLMQAGGGTSNVSNLTLTFDDLGAPMSSTSLSSGTYRPTTGSLAAFNGADPGGQWQLTIAKAPPGGQGQISGGWSMSLTTDAFPQTFTFTDSSLVAAQTTIKTAHLIELRNAINTLRSRNGLAAASFTDVPPVVVRLEHIGELRTALASVFTSIGRIAPAYTDPALSRNVTPVKAIHFEQLRAAIREADAMKLTVTKAGSGAGTVTSNPAGVNCGSDCLEAYRAGKVVTLTATAASLSAFAGWTGACEGMGECQVTMDAAASVVATFNPAPLTITVNKTGAGSGTVISVPEGISCGATCVQGFATGTAVNLYANPAAGSAFSGWSGACSGTSTCQVTVNSSQQVTAAFNGAATSTYDAQPGYAHLGAGGGCNGGIIGHQFTVTAPANVNWTVGWTGSDLPPSSHAGSLNHSSGTGNGSVIFTITIAAQSPTYPNTCANVATYAFGDTFFFRFYDSGGTKVGEVITSINWTYRLVL
jgi:hypothetical protein